MVMEFGDKDRAQGSIYLKGLGNLTQEIHLEILRRDKLDYLLKRIKHDCAGSGIIYGSH